MGSLKVCLQSHRHCGPFTHLHLRGYFSSLCPQLGNRGRLATWLSCPPSPVAHESTADGILGKRGDLDSILREGNEMARDPRGLSRAEILNHHLPQPDIIAENKAAFCFDLSGQEHRFLNQGQQCGRLGCRTGSGGCSEAQNPRPGGQLLGKGGDRMGEG